MYKTTAKTDLQNYADAKLEANDYSAEGLADIAVILFDGKAAILEANDKPAVDVAKEDAILAIDAVPPNKSEHMLNNETINLIKQDATSIIQVPMDDIFFYYYGTFNGNVVLIVLPGSGGRMEWYDIFDIYYPNTNFIRVWRNRSFYNLTESYDQGILTTSDLEQIAEIHENEFYNIYYNRETWI